VGCPVDILLGTGVILINKVKYKKNL